MVLFLSFPSSLSIPDDDVVCPTFRKAIWGTGCAPGAMATPGLAKPQEQAAPAPRSFYRRPLPASCVPFSSAEGRKRFSSALAGGGCEGAYFVLSEHFTTQGRVWKGAWRWYHEEMLDCCKPLDKVRETGITFSELRCLAACNGAKAKMRHAKSAADGRDSCCMDGTLDSFRKDVVATCGYVEGAEGDSGCGRKLMICSYSRKILGQTGSGHFSPVAAYDTTTDSVLIMDVARFKYPPHWVSIRTLHEAMVPPDPDTGKPRGWMLLSRPRRGQALASSMLLCVPTWDDQTSQAWSSLAEWLRSRRAGGDSAKGVGDGVKVITPEETWGIVSRHGGVSSMLIEDTRPKALMNGRDAALLAIEEFTSYSFFLAKPTREAPVKRSCCDEDACADSPCCGGADATAGTAKECCVGVQKSVSEAHLLTIVHEACVREQASWGSGDECASEGLAPSRAASGGGGLLSGAQDGAEEGLCVSVSGKELASIEVSAVRAKLRALPEVPESEA